MSNERIKFAADEMLGTLARWLRIIGYDTIYEKNKSDEEIEAQVLREKRILLTRDKNLAKKLGERSLYIESDELYEQLRQVIKSFDLVMDEDFTRCTLCNGEVDRVTQKEVENEVPVGALINNTEFFRCRSCGKVYWKGSHWENILKTLERIEGNE
ncbi:MAG: Mut7-C RNAse domain-containing protein [Methanomassiliicoccales archaeon]|nr:Mut7-C RNAse domain-containing protein [Methanomassiliicoccales archaeon]